MTIPVPATTIAILINSTGKPTRHEYVATEECAPPPPAGDPYAEFGEPDRAFVFKFRCVETGAIRTFGMEGPAEEASAA